MSPWLKKWSLTAWKPHCSSQTKRELAVWRHYRREMFYRTSQNWVMQLKPKIRQLHHRHCNHLYINVDVQSRNSDIGSPFLYCSSFLCSFCSRKCYVMLPPTSLEALLYFFVRNFAFTFSQVTIKCILDVSWPARPYRLYSFMFKS